MPSLNCTMKHKAMTRINYINLHVLSSVPTEVWADPQRDGMCGSPLRGGADYGGRALLRMDVNLC
jgi:hypothetical protein